MNKRITPICSIALLIVCSNTLHAQVYRALDFSGSRTAIVRGGSTVGYSFNNVYGDGSDAIIDVVWNKALSVNNKYFAAGVNDNQTSPLPNPRVGEILIGNGSSQLPTLSTSSPKSLAIYLRPYADVPFLNETVSMRFDFKIRNAAGNALNNRRPYRFITRDLDGEKVGTDRKTRESITLIGASNVNVVDRTFITQDGNRLTGKAQNINPSTGNTQGTAYWDFARSTFSMDLAIDYRATSSKFKNVPGDRGFVFDANTDKIPEPSNLALLGLGALSLVLRRQR